MKLEKLLALTVVVAMAAAVAGCRYNKANRGAEGEEADAAASLADTAEGQDLETEGDGQDVGPTMLGDVAGADGAIVTDRPFSETYKPVEGADFAPVYFGFDSTAVPPAEFAKIEAVAADLAANPGHVVVVEGNCDERGSNEYNMSLGENRAIIVRDQLVQLGVAAERIQTKSYGEEKPAVTGSGESVWAQNRRAEFALYQR